ncbi:MAG: hypothetical protein WAM26_11350, partial [Nitrososphaeraceae archaeon]
SWMDIMADVISSIDRMQSMRLRIRMNLIYATGICYGNRNWKSSIHVAIFVFWISALLTSMTPYR